jgi:hypothetical protein
VVGFEGVHAAADVGRIPAVVVTGPHEIGAARQLEDGSEIGDRSDVLVQPTIGDPVVRAGDLTADLRGPVGGRVVGDEKPEVRIVLGKQRIKRLAKVPLAVVGRQADADARVADRSTSATLPRRPDDGGPVVIMPR